eukprot:scaffold116847_cov39-Prasinocladus_malaysianus.AAC.1
MQLRAARRLYLAQSVPGGSLLEAWQRAWLISHTYQRRASHAETCKILNTETVCCPSFFRRVSRRVGRMQN